MINAEGNEVYPSLVERMGFLEAFTSAQRRAIIERDGGKCQAAGIIPHHCNEDDKQGLQVHHLKPQMFLKKFGVDPDFPENALTLCSEVHQKIIHEDCKDARRDYHKGNHNAFNELQGRRAETLNNREPYWNTKFDRALEVRALKLTQTARRNGWEFPEKE